MHAGAAAGQCRCDARAARAARLRRRAPPRHRRLPRAEVAPAALPRRRGGRGQDGDREGAGRRSCAAARAAAMLRRPRHRGGGLRVELSAADDRDPARGSRGRRRARRACARHLHDALSAAPAAAAGARARGRRAAGAADRRARSRRRAVRGVSARSAVRLPGDHSRARHDPREDAAGRRHHVEPHARDPRRDQAPLPLSLGRLSRRRARARDRAPQMPGGVRVARARDRRVHAAAAHARSCSRRRASPRRSTGPKRWSRSTGSRSIRKRSPTRSARCSSIRTTSRAITPDVAAKLVREAQECERDT